LRFDRSFDDEVAIALSAMDSVLLGSKAVYASSELTSGRRAQRLQREHNVPNHVSLRDGLGPDHYHTLLWSPNVAEAVAFAEELRSRLGTADVVISPAPFSAPSWPQTAYLLFWEQVIRTRIRSVYFNDGWEYSTGCVFEFAIATDVGLPTFDRAARRLPALEAIERVGRAIAEMESSQLDSRNLRTSLTRLEQAARE
jgi:hypothetical protein